MRNPLASHIGIVACSAEGAALCYRTICAEGPALLGPHAHPEISLHALSLSDYVDCLERGDIAGVGELMLHSAQRLAASGATFLICPDNTIHQALDAILPRHGIECVRPCDSDRDFISAIIIDELVAGILKPASVSVFQAVIERFREQGCDAVILGCTEIPLIINDANACLPTLDSTRLLARAALVRATSSALP